MRIHIPLKEQPKDEKDLIIEDLKTRLAALEAREKQRDPSFKVPDAPDGLKRK